MVEVPYKGIPPAVMDTIAGEVSFTFADFAVALAQIKGGKVKGLGVTSQQRSSLAPELPPIADTLPGFETILWWGLVAPRRHAAPDHRQGLRGPRTSSWPSPRLWRRSPSSDSTPHPSGPTTSPLLHQGRDRQMGARCTGSRLEAGVRKGKFTTETQRARRR
ncbi:MAG: tripartite tricarboxylate transporter substrate-binding protein [Pseudomonadota bacterium]